MPGAIYSRSANLRSYAGDTSLPGGKVDLEDRTIEETAVSGALSLLLSDRVELEYRGEKRLRRCDPS